LNAAAAVASASTALAADIEVKRAGWPAQPGKKMNTMKSLITVAAVAALLVATAGAHDPNGKVDRMNAALQPLTGAEFEQSFLQQMIQHHRSAVDMAKMVRDQSRRKELQQFADKMITSQQAEIDKMTGWLKDWFQTTPKSVANEAAGEEMKGHLAMLKDKKDADFDKAFLQMMPQHHHAAVEMAEQAQKKATRPELKELAAKMAKDQSEEIRQLKSWAQAWFGPA
jgi:uncharacterized protein (DUF305 family)